MKPCLTRSFAPGTGVKVVRVVGVVVLPHIQVVAVGPAYWPPPKSYDNMAKNSRSVWTYCMMQNTLCELLLSIHLPFIRSGMILPLTDVEEMHYFKTLCQRLKK